MDMGTITMLIGIIGCMVGVATFAVGMTTRAKNDGQLLERIQTCVNGIEEIKKDLKENTHGISAHDKTLSALDSRMTAAEKDIENIYARLNHIEK